MPTFLAPGTGFVEDNFFHGLGWGWFGDDSSAFIYCAFYFYYCYISSSSDHQALDVGTPIFDNGWHTRSSDRMKLLWVGEIRNSMMCWEVYELSLQTKLRFYPPFSYYMLCDISKFLNLCKSQFKFLSNKNHFIYIYIYIYIYVYIVKYFKWGQKVNMHSSACHPHVSVQALGVSYPQPSTGSASVSHGSTVQHCLCSPISYCRLGSPGHKHWNEAPLQAQEVSGGLTCGRKDRSKTRQGEPSNLSKGSTSRIWIFKQNLFICVVLLFVCLFFGA